jgi:hypothetical protein
MFLRKWTQASVTKIETNGLLPSLDLLERGPKPTLTRRVPEMLTIPIYRAIPQTEKTTRAKHDRRTYLSKQIGIRISRWVYAARLVLGEGHRR